jgi:two-component system, OmpR family, copper resistance phosphate regulon response regulator CusR
MLRSGISFPVLMKLLGHVDPGMTMRYVDVALTDLEREFQLARSKPRHLAPQPKTSTAPVRTGLDGLIDALVAAQHLMEMFRRSLTTVNARNRLLRLSKPPHQDPRRDKKTPEQLNENGKRLAAYGDFRVESKTDGKDAGDALSGNIYDLLILDLNLPDMDGIDFLKKIRGTQPKLPILVLTARDGVEDVVRGLDEGADDCLRKPFSFMELTARIGVLLSRSFVAPVAIAPTAGGLRVDRDGHQAFRDQRRIDLTHREFEILEYLMNNIGKALSRKTLMEDIWKIAYDPSTNIVDVYVKYLRDKIAIEGETKLIRTVRGVGYVLSDGCELPASRLDDAAARRRVHAATLIGAARAA